MVVVLVLCALLLGLLAGWLLGSRSAAASEHQLRATFGALSAEALQRNTDTLVRLAEQRLAADTSAADRDLAAVVDPLRAALDAVAQQLRSVERGRAASDAALSEQLTAMRQSSDHLWQEANRLVTALRAPQVRGRWGELQLERTVEAAGMTDHVDYVTQATARGEEGTVRPDLVVHLVGGKQVVVDSKVAFSAYLEAMEARDDAARDGRLKAHARQLRDHVTGLAAKAYWERFTPSPEFVVCFVPADAFLDAALRKDPGLLEYAFGRNVVLATPSTLVALLRTVAYTWRQDALAANAAEVHRLGKELYQRLCTVGGHLDRLGKSIADTVDTYNSAISSLETRVFVSARRLADLEVAESSEALQPRQVTRSVRLAQAPELADHTIVALPTGNAGADRRKPDGATAAGQ